MTYAEALTDTGRATRRRPRRGLHRWFDAIPAMMHAIDGSGRIVAVSDAWLRTLGYERIEVLGRLGSDFLTPESRRRSIEDVIPEFFRLGHVENVDYQMIAKDGRIVDIVVSAILNNGGSDIDFYGTIVITDVTARKAAERRLVESESRYRGLVEDQSEFVSLATPDGVLSFVNGAYARHFRAKPQELVGRSLFDLVPPESRGPLAQHFREVCRTGEGLEFENQVALPGGEIRWVAWTNRAIRDARGEVTGIHSVGRDIEARVAAERRLRESEARSELARIEAENANRAKTDFLAVMSHEIRSPLTSISGFVDLLSQSGGLDHRQRRYVELAKTANAALLTVLNDILDFSKVEAGRLELENRPFILDKLVHDTVAIVRPLAVKKNLRLTYDLQRGLPGRLVGDDARLRQVLLNLLNNAIKFTEAGSIAVLVRRPPGAAGDQLRFSVVDTGIGVPAEQQSRLFRDFSQADTTISRRYGGTGLGLAICRRLVELMGGEIGVVSEGGEGSTLWFTANLPPASEKPEEPEPNSTLAETGVSEARILLVDDIDTNREIVSAFLTHDGHRVVAADSAKAALDALQRESFDLVLMDVQMPETDGVTATRMIRSLPPPVRDTPIIAMTGNVLSHQVDAFRAAGMNDHVGKPIDRSELYRIVRRWLPQTAQGPHRAAPCRPVASTARTA